MLLSFPSPINYVEVYYKRFVNIDEARNIYKLIYTSKGLESFEVTDKTRKGWKNLNPETKRGSFHTFGIVLRPTGRSEDNLDDAPVDEEHHAQVFLNMQLEILTKDDKVNQVPFMTSFMFDLIDKL